MKAVKQFMFNNVWIMRAGEIKTKGLLRLLFLRKSVGWIEEEQNQRMQHFIQHMLQWWQSTTSLFWYSAIFLSLLLRVFLLSLEYVFSQTWQSIFMHVQMADLKNPTKQKCTDNIHSHMHDNVNNYKYWRPLVAHEPNPLSQLINSRRTPMQSYNYQVLFKSVWASGLKSSETLWQMGIYSHYWNDCWHVPLNKTRVEVQMKMSRSELLMGTHFLFSSSAVIMAFLFSVCTTSRLRFVLDVFFFLRFFFWGKEKSQTTSWPLDWMSCLSSE